MYRALSTRRLVQSYSSFMRNIRGLSQGEAQNTAGEKKLTSILKEKFPKSKTVKVEDISGGCGAMYEIHIEAEEFIGKKMIMQHRMVNEALKEEIKEMHGLRINSSAPER